MANPQGPPIARFHLESNDRSYWTLPLEPSTTAEQICQLIATKLEIEKDTFLMYVEGLNSGPKGTFSHCRKFFFFFCYL
jgi:hypothetical protein